MSDKRGKNQSSEGGIVGDHSPTEPPNLFVAPSTAGQFNCIRTPLIPIACWRVDDVRFEFGSSFVVPEMAKELRFLAELRQQHKSHLPHDAPQLPAVYPPISIFGHADSVSGDDQDKKLSGRRAAAVYALLTRNTSLWEQLFARPMGPDDWGMRSVEIMLSALGYAPDSANANQSRNLRDEIARFQQANGLATDGQPGPATRAKLFLAYMDKLCGDDLKLDSITDFLAQGADPAGKGDYQGCGAFNPVTLLSQQEEDRYSQSASKQPRNDANAPNRRVVALLFRPNSRVTVSKWPCPRVNEDGGGCMRRFWSDGEKRRGTRLPDERRVFENSADTFACRFYQRLSTGSPCEGALPIVRVRLFDRLGRVIPHAPYTISLNGTDLPAGTADANGDVIIRHVIKPTSCLIRWSAIHPKDEEPVFSDQSNDDDPCPKNPDA